MKNEVIRHIEIEKILESPFQGRFLDFDQAVEKISISDKDIEELARSISQSGLLQPILLRELSDQTYELIDGHRRLMAYKYLGRTTIEALVRDMSDQQAQVQSIIGNLQRKNLTKIELASAYKKVLDTGLFATAKDLSIALGKDETFVSDTINLLKLDRRIIDDLGKNDTIKDVRLLRQIRNYAPTDVQGDSQAQFDLYQRVLNEKLTREDVKDIIVKQKHTDKHEQPFYKILPKGRKKILIELATDNLSTDKKAILERMLHDKLREVEALFNDNQK